MSSPVFHGTNFFTLPSVSGAALYSDSSTITAVHLCNNEDATIIIKLIPASLKIFPIYLNFA